MSFKEFLVIVIVQEQALSLWWEEFKRRLSVKYALGLKGRG